MRTFLKQGLGATAYLAQRTPGMGLPTPALAGLLRHIRPATPASGQQVRISAALDSRCAPVGGAVPAHVLVKQPQYLHTCPHLVTAVASCSSCKGPMIVPC